MLFALTGCSDARATADEFHSAGSDSSTFAENLSATQALVGGDWLVRDDPSGRSCAVAFGGTGETAPALRIMVISADAPQPAATAEAVASVVASAWTRWGYTVTQSVRQHSVGEVAEVQGRQQSGEYLVFRASDKALTLQGESACKPTA